jgi:hypothetical protein
MLPMTNAANGIRRGLMAPIGTTARMCVSVKGIFGNDSKLSAMILEAAVAARKSIRYTQAQHYEHSH